MFTFLRLIQSRLKEEWKQPKKIYIYWVVNRVLRPNFIPYFYAISVIDESRIIAFLCHSQRDLNVHWHFVTGTQCVKICLKAVLAYRHLSLCWSLSLSLSVYMKFFFFFCLTSLVSSSVLVVLHYWLTLMA